jgi:hypothetical protein
MFLSFVARKDTVKMKKQINKKPLEASWKVPYLFVGHVVGKNEINSIEKRYICIIEGLEEA